jgi:hypothetical protein
MGNIISLVLSYRLNKDHKEKEENKEEHKKENICSYLYGKYNIKDDQITLATNSIL